MNRRLAVLALFAPAVLMPVAVEAGGRGRYNSTPPMTPFGPAYDPATFREAGGNPILYEELWANKVMAAQQKAMIQQQQQWQKMQQQQKHAKNTAAVAPGTVPPFQPAFNPPRPRKKRGKRPNIEVMETKPAASEPRPAKGNKTTTEAAKPTEAKPATDSSKPKP